MRINRATRSAGAFSLIELLCVLAIIGVLAALLLPALSQTRAQAKRVECVNHLRQIGIAFQNFAQDHNGLFPMSVPVNAGGSLEFARNAYGIAGKFYFSFHHFQVLSNELVTPKVIICPTDTRQPAANFAVLGNQAVSYFVGISAVPASPDSILAGDRNLTNDWVEPATLLRFGPNNSLRWTLELHRFKGDLLFADGRVEERNTPGLVGSGNQALVTADLALPTVQDPANPATKAQRASPNESSAPGREMTAAPGPNTTSQQQAVSKQNDIEPSPNPVTAHPGWSSAFSSGESQPDSPLPQANLQPGTNSDILFLTNSTPHVTKAEDPGFSLFPPLFGQGGLATSAGGHWILLILVLLLLIAWGVLLRRRWAKSQLLRRAYRDFFPIL